MDVKGYLSSIVIVAFLLAPFAYCGKAGKKINNLLIDSSEVSKPIQAYKLVNIFNKDFKNKEGRREWVSKTAER